MIFNSFLRTKGLFGLLVLCSVILTTSCSKDDDDDDTLRTQTFQYEMHNGQVVPSAPYAGVHPSDFPVTLQLEELENGNTNITVTIQKSLDGVRYHMHAHDAADPTTTPNGTPYVEAPNGDIFAQALDGNGGSVSISQEANRSFDELINDYNGFFVVHDPLQAISTTDLGTFLVVGGFARAQASTNYASSTFQYDFNTGQIAPTFAYNGPHNDNLSASIKVDELADNQSRVTVHIMNTIDGETYHTHAHDAADQNNTPNGTPYIEAPNADIFAAPIAGNGGTAASAVISSSSFSDITTSYEGFFVIHDPLQGLSTTDPTTFIVLGQFAR